MPPSAVTECDACMKSMRKNGSSDRYFRCSALTLILITALAALSAGCAGGRVASPGASYDSPETALRVLAASGSRGTITATARIEISYHGERYPLKAAMMMRRPADLRLESIPILGPPDFFLSIERGELRVFLPGKGTFSTGPATRWNISRFLHLPLTAAEIVSLLMGHPPPEWEASNSRHGERDEGLYRVDRYDAGERKIGSLWIDPVAGLLVRARAFTEGEAIAYTADFADHIRLGAGFLPQRLKISGEAVSLVLRYTEIGLLDDDAASFALPVPEGITPIPLDGK
jgi:hypothetical protein